VSFTVRRLHEDSPRRSAPWKKILPAAKFLMRLGRPLVAWWLVRGIERNVEEHAHKMERVEKREKRLRILRRIFATSCIILAIVFAGALGVRALVHTKILNIRTLVSVTGTDLPRDAFGHVNILLLGTGDETHDGVDLTDTIMIASIDPARNGSVALFSIPRDLYVRSQKMGNGRINSLYRDYKHWLIGKDLSEEGASQEAMKELALEIGRLTNVDIRHVIKVDFIGFVQAVDAVGGVDIDVPYNLVDHEYPGPNYSYQTFAINKGLQHLDGETALKYARSRHSTSDFSRSARQQQIIKALGQKVKDEGVLSNPGRLLSLLQIMENHVETTMTTRELVGLGGLGMGLNQSNVLSMGLSIGEEAGGFLYTPPREAFAGASVLLPHSWKQVRGLTHLLINIRAPLAARSEIRILNAGAPEGSSRRLGRELGLYGLNVIETVNAEDRNQETSYLQSTEDDAAGVFLAPTLGLEHRIVEQPEITGTGSRLPVTISLGKDFVFREFADLLAPPPALGTEPALEVPAIPASASGSLSSASTVSSSATSAFVSSESFESFESFESSASSL
jgi:polyisoprenyl-teichoic acid--peptidoglycan teichoic acid transferase